MQRRGAIYGIFGGLRRFSDVSVRSKPRKRIEPDAIDTAFTMDQGTVPAGRETEYAGTPLWQLKKATAFIEAGVRFHEPKSYQAELYSVYAYNLPLRVNEDRVVEALCNVGQPEQISIFDVRGLPVDRSVSNMVKPKRVSGVGQKSKRRVWPSVSPINGILSFGSEAVFLKATMPENKLFGILCKSNDETVDGQRTMFLEPADRKRSLVAVGFDESNTFTWFQEVFRDSLASFGPVNLKVGRSRGTESTLKNTQIALQFRSFEEALAVFRHFESTPLSAGVNISFSPFRSSLSDGRFIDKPSFNHDLSGMA